MKKKVLSAVLSAVLSMGIAVNGDAAEYYLYGYDLVDANTTWDSTTKTAALSADRNIGYVTHYAKTFGSQSHPGNEIHIMSLITYDTYKVAGFNGTEKLNLTGDVLVAGAEGITIKNLDEFTISDGTCGLDISYGADNGSAAGLYLDNIKKVDVSGTLSAIYGDFKAKVDIKNVETLNLDSNINYGTIGNPAFDVDSTIYAFGGSIMDIEAQNVNITSNGYGIVAKSTLLKNGLSAKLVDVTLKTENLNFKSDNNGSSATTVYSDDGATVSLGTADNKIKNLEIADKVSGTEAYSNMNLYTTSYMYEEKGKTGEDRWQNEIASGKTADDYIFHPSTINVYAEKAIFKANTDSINARNNSRINVNVDKLDITNYYGNNSTINASHNSLVTIDGDEVSVKNANKYYHVSGGVTEEAGTTKFALSGGGLVNPSRVDLQEKYAGTVDNAGNIEINAAKTLELVGDVVIETTPGDSTNGNHIYINKENMSAYVNAESDIYTDNGNQVIITLGDGSAAGQSGKSLLKGAVGDKASAIDGFSFSDTIFSDVGTTLNMQDATWSVTKDSELYKVSMVGDSFLDASGNKTFDKVKINELSGSGTVKLDYDDSQTSTDGTTADKLFINNHAGNHYIFLNEVNGVTSLTGNAVDTVLVSVVNENGAFQAASNNGLIWSTYALDSKESVATGYTTDWYLKKNDSPGPGPNPVKEVPTAGVVGTVQSYNSNYYLWRDQIGSLTKRLGDTCFDDDREGLWVRMQGQSLGGSGDFGADAKVKTYTIGYDFKNNSKEYLAEKVSNKARDFTGVALEYTKGKAGLHSIKDDAGTNLINNGRSDIRGGSLIAYHTHISETGRYLDLVGKYSVYNGNFHNSDMTGQETSGKTKSTGWQASAEYGHRYENEDGYFMVPNAQLTFGSLHNRGVLTSDGIWADGNNTNSFIGSVGIDLGKKISNQSRVYLKARYNKEFGGSVNTDFHKDGKSLHVDGDTNSKWWEYGVGMNFKPGHASHIYLDAERANGGNFQRDWSWRVGARFDF